MKAGLMWDEGRVKTACEVLGRSSQHVLLIVVGQESSLKKIPFRSQHCAFVARSATGNVCEFECQNQSIKIAHTKRNCAAPK